jgi:hypothetical protein
VEEVIASYALDENSKSLLSKLSIEPTAVPHYTLQNGLLRYKNTIWVGANHELQLKLMQACHNSALGGHSGVQVTYMRMKQLFAWRGMKKAIHNFVQSGMSTSKIRSC